MTVINTTTDNEYYLTKRNLSFHVTSSRDNSIYSSENLYNSVQYIIKTERQYILNTAMPDFLEDVRHKLSSLNVSGPDTDSIYHLSLLVAGVEANKSYYDNLLMRIYQSFLGQVEVFEFDQANDFNVADELTHAIKDGLHVPRTYQLPGE